MGIGISVFLLGLGAVLAFAVEATVAGVSITTVGVILMVVGALGLVLTLLVADRLVARRDERVVVRERELV